MSTITYGAAPAAALAAKRKGLLARFFANLMRARERQAIAVLKRHRHLLPRELEQAGWSIGARSEDSLPFVR
jgi:hypothetical protein